jgi:hypothetical protein
MGREQKELHLHTDSDFDNPLNAHRIAENRLFVVSAGNFLEHSGINDAVIRFSHDFLPEGTLITNEVSYVDILYDNKVSKSANSSIVLYWEEPDDLRRMVFKVTAGRNETGNKYLSASFREITPHKPNNHDDSPVNRVIVRHLARNFHFDTKLMDDEKVKLHEWLGSILSDQLLLQ